MREPEREHANFFAALWETTPNVMWICRLLPDDDYQFTDINNNCQAVFPELHRGRLMSEVIASLPTAPAAALVPALRQCRSTGKAAEVLLDVESALGRKSIKIHLVPVFSPGSAKNPASRGFHSILALGCNLDMAFSELVKQNEDLRKAGERYLDLALKDPLTSLANRRCFQQVADKEFERARRYGRALTLILLDMDNLKLVNDEQGHQAGDAALKAIGAALISASRTTDTVARIGGDEFAIILPETSCADGIVIAARANAAIAKGYLLPDGQRAMLSMSAGVAGLISTDAAFDAIFVRSDRALYRAKNTGKNRTEADCPDLP